jgi:hypothetical protein
MAEAIIFPLNCVICVDMNLKDVNTTSFCDENTCNYFNVVLTLLYVFHGIDLRLTDWLS